MSLLNHTLKYLAVAMFIMLSVWAVIFYVNMLDEVYDSLDDGLDNYKMLILDKVAADSVTLGKSTFAESNYAIREMHPGDAIKVKDSYKDTLMYMINEEDLEPVRMLTTAFTHHGHFYELKVISSMVEEDDLIEDLFYALIWLYVALLAGILIINNVLLRKVWRPFYNLIDQLKAFRLGKSKFNTAPTSIREFRQLNETVEGLISRSTEAYNSQKQFIENASHELQTPVAISINKLELLSENAHLKETELAVVGQVIQTLERLKRLNKSLLLLSKIENRQFAETSDVVWNDIARTQLEDFQDLSSYKDVHLQWVEKGRFVRNMDKDLAVILISNLIKNAIVHNVPGGHVTVEMGDGYFVVTNSGTMEPLSTEKIFNRFHKDSSDNQHTGLGLAIVKAIADLYQLKISYAYVNAHQIRVDG